MTTYVVKGTAVLLACCGLAAFSSTETRRSPAPRNTVEPTVAENTVPDCGTARAKYDAVIGPGDFNVVQPIRLGTAADMKRQMIARLTYVEALLRSRDVADLTPELRAERLRNLDRLHAYRLRAEFPANDAYPGRLRPCFIDADGNICAVGYLVEQSVGRPAAERVNARYQYATVNQIRSTELDAWIARSGFTHAEVATIQEPGFNRRFVSEKARPAIADADGRMHVKPSLRPSQRPNERPEAKPVVTRNVVAVAAPTAQAAAVPVVAGTLPVQPAPAVQPVATAPQVPVVAPAPAAQTAPAMQTSRIE